MRYNFIAHYTLFSGITIAPAAPSMQGGPSFRGSPPSTVHRQARERLTGSGAWGPPSMHFEGGPPQVSLHQ